MLRTINFDNQLLAEFRKVDNIAVDSNLAAKMMAMPIKVLQLHPQFDLLRGHRLAQLPGSQFGHGLG